MSTPIHILKRLRMRRDLDKNDTSMDQELNDLSPIEKLREIVAWELGDPNWADQILEWAKYCGMTKLD